MVNHTLRHISAVTQDSNRIFTGTAFDQPNYSMTAKEYRINFAEIQLWYELNWNLTCKGYKFSKLHFKSSHKQKNVRHSFFTIVTIL